MPPPKSNSTCTQCRARKVRCGGGPDCCSNCQRLNFACSFATSSPGSHSQVSTGIERRRVSRACYQCRAQKSKCSGELPRCETCRARGGDGECTYPEVKRPHRLAPRPATVHGTRNVNRGASSSVSPVSQQSLSHQGTIQHSPPLHAAPLEATGALTHASSLSAGFATTETVPDGRAQAPMPSASSDRGHGSSASAFCASPSSCASSSHPLPPIRDQLRLINDFFRHIHPIPTYSFLNEVSTTQHCLDGTLDDTLLSALCAVTALHLKYAKYYPASASVWIQRAEDLIWSRIERPSMLRTQALILVVQYRIESGAFQKAYMLLSLAARCASAMRLQYERLDLGNMAQEIRRRVMWSLTLLDAHFSVGLPEMEVCPHDTIYVKLPCKEENFVTDDEDVGTFGIGANDSTTLSLDGVAEDGLLSIHIRVAVVRRDICKLMRQVRLCGQPMPGLVHIVGNVIHLLQQLEIPHYSYEELQRFSTSPWLPRYLSAFCSWHQSHCDIYRLFLSGYKEAAPAIVISACPRSYVLDAVRKCYHHANANIALLLDLSELRPASLRVLDNDLAICGYHACRLILYISRLAHLDSSGSPSEEEHNIHPPLRQQTAFMSPVEASNKAIKVLALLKRHFSESLLLKQLLRDLETIIQSHINGESAEPRRASSDAEESGPEAQPPRYAAAVQRHRSLGVHSILRQARFQDDDSAESTDTDSHVLRTRGHSGASLDNRRLSLGKGMETAPLRQVSGPDELMDGGSSLSSLPAVPPTSSLNSVMSDWPHLVQAQGEPQIIVSSGDNGGGGSSNSNNIDGEADFTLMPDGLELAQGTIWNDWSWEHFFSPTSDMDLV